MIKITAIASLIAIFAFPVLADTKTVYYPEKACDQIVSQEYSTGGGDTMWQYVEILCEDSEGNYTGFVAKWGSGAGMLGLGRLAMVDKFVYKPYSGSKLKVE